MRDLEIGTGSVIVHGSVISMDHPHDGSISGGGCGSYPFSVSNVPRTLAALRWLGSECAIFGLATVPVCPADLAADAGKLTVVIDWRRASTAAKYSSVPVAQRCPAGFARIQRASTAPSYSYAVTLQARGWELVRPLLQQSDSIRGPRLRQLGPSTSLSFSLIRDRSARFIIGCDARPVFAPSRSGLNID